MGYSITIGELTFENDEHQGRKVTCFRAEVASNPSAPAFGEPTDYKSARCPSYSMWEDFVEYVGLKSLFFGKEVGQSEVTRGDHLIREESVVPLTEQHRLEVNAAFEAYQAKHPGANPTFEVGSTESNRHMARLVWLHYWVNWALDNCKNPVFECR